MQQLRRSHPPSPFEIEGAIANDGEQPRPKLLRRLARIQMLHRREKCVLHRIIRIGGFTQYGERHTVCRADMALHERPERHGVATLRAGDEYGV